MFSAGEDAGPAEPVIEGARLGDDLLHISAVAAATKRIVGLVIVGDVENGAQIEVESEDPQQPACDVAVFSDKIEIIAVSELLGVRGLVPDQLQPRNPAALLVDGDDRLDIGKIPQVIDEFPQLQRRLDVAAEKNKSSNEKG